MGILLFLSIFLTLLIFEIIYFKIAKTYNIIDQPNHRSSHSSLTIRGGGIIFLLSILLCYICYGIHYPFFIAGLLIIGLISFIDDITPTSRRVRIIFHLIALLLLFYQLQLYNLPYYWVFFVLVVCISIINAVNFMDGINGITGGFGLVTVITLYYINEYVVPYTEAKLLIFLILALLVFNIFNFRTKAKCFAGDVGSVSLAFIMLFFLIQLIIKTNNINYILLFLIYGLDTVTTILLRVIKKENIFVAHRDHFYQFLANEKKIPHIQVSALFTVIQLATNILIIKLFSKSVFTLMVSIVVSLCLFIAIRIYVEGSNILKKKQ